MSGIVAASQSGGCCCRPLPCQCTNPNRPGAIVDASLTAINIEAEYNYIERFRINRENWYGCEGCPCGSGLGGAAPPEVVYVYQRNGCSTLPAFTEGTPCTPCTASSCVCCPEYAISATFGNRVLEKQPGALWSTVFRSSLEHIAGSWNWQPRMVGFCIPTDSVNVRVRKFCNFAPIQTIPGPSTTPAKDPNGQYIDANGNYLGGNVGPCHMYAAASVRYVGGASCYYEARIQMYYTYQEWQSGLILDRGGTWVWNPAGLMTGGAVYRKPCRSPFDSVLGNYECVFCDSSYYYDDNTNCGPFARFQEQDITFPDFLTVS